MAEAVVALQKPGGDAFSPVAYYPGVPQGGLKLAEVTERALREGQGVVLQAGERHQLAHPVRVEGELRGVVALELEARGEGGARAAMRELQWGAGWLEVLLRRHADPHEHARLKLKLALDLVAVLLEHEGLTDGGAAFVTELASRLGCDRVTLGVLENGRVRLRAVSHSGQFDARANVVRAVEHAMEEALDQRETIVWPQADESRALVSMAHAQLLRESEAGAALTLPLARGERLAGALTLERSSGFGFDAPSLELCEAVAAVAGPIVELKLAAERGLARHAADESRALWRKLIGPRHAGLKLTAALTAAAALFLGLASGEFRVSAESTVEGEMQRVIAAPVAGFVHEAPRRAGDAVRKGELIARLDDRDLKLERVKLLGQVSQYGQQYREAMAGHNRPQAAMVLAQLDQTNAQLALVQEQLARAEMLAPFDGVIVSGDFSQKLGAPVERGQTLFEVAPSASFRIALQVDERDFSYVSVGQRGRLIVASIPNEAFPLVVTRITAVNLPKDGRNTFRVEARLEGDPGRLRPGMEGVGKIEIDERKYVWIWTHTLTDWVRLTLWSWLP
ncbi:MAG TPA: HlyD family efflux transporter periplasmic adaptor subunit [Burkholderiales bacterium]|nr:HlyD family efflux transporter periplasmic adaptor subunit [Burkholderiales bacterium]